MRKLLVILPILASFCLPAKAGYNDHRFHNVDSLETVMAGWTANDLASASEEQLKPVASDIDELMNGYLQTNGVKSEYYARTLLGLSRRFGWFYREQGAAKIIGQHFWAKEQYDSAAFYYNIAVNAVQKMSKADSGNEYTPDDIDDALSQMYGTIGNLFSMMDSISVAMDYYEKAGVIFKKHGWHNSSSILYYNMGETMRVSGSLRQALPYYEESLKYAQLAGDSLAIATAYKGLGSAYLEAKRTSKALEALARANEYFAGHEKEELQYRMESLDYTGQVLELQKKRLSVIVFLLLAVLLLSGAALYVARRLKKATAQNKELNEVLEDTVTAICGSGKTEEFTLKPREKEILDLVAKGYTNAQIADALCLSPDTIKWYKKKLFAMFEAANSADLVRLAKDKGLL